MFQPTVHEYVALQMPTQKVVTVKLVKLRLHSSGVFSNVYRGVLLEPSPQREVAVKKTWPEDELETKNYETMMLLELSKEKHLNIVQILYTFKTRAPDDRICISMVFDFMPSTLHSIIKSLAGQNPNIIDIKIYTWQLFNGLHFLSKACCPLFPTNRKKICHRDIKPQNLLIDSHHGALKIADFGSSKILKPNVESTPYQVTRFYRPIELLLDAFFYTPMVDVWSAGCCLGEMFLGSPLFPGRDTKHQLRLIIEALGTPTSNDLREMRALARSSVTPVIPRGLSSLLPYCDRQSIEFMQRILVYNPNKRLCGLNLLSDSYFSDLLVPHKKRHNGRLVADIPCYNEMMLLGLKNYLSPQRPIKTTKSFESTKPTVYSTQENVIADKW
ncbi:Protein kinase domain-containing protein [Aphelenchoides besseyi]|nr:Protein kinase domain-containing protein [Aphelenchoides besseyi]